MAFTPTNLLKLTDNVLLRDQQHASRLFVDDQFRLAPKWDFSFHVAFGLNQSALKSIDLAQRHGNEIGMLVKNITLPKFTISVDQVNQYNRKKQIQSFHKYEDVTVKFHDDNMGLINQLWQNYYSYYYADSTSAVNTGAYNRNATRSSDFINTAFGLDNGSTEPFFTYIKVYQMARHEYICYTLYNPIIKSWDHQSVDYAKKETHDFSMTLAYEAVAYSTGEVTAGDPIGFGLEHYDVTPSPLSGNGDGLSASPSFTNNRNLTNNASSFLSNLVTTNNTYQNTQDQAPTGTTGLLSTTTNQTTGGLQGITFPTAQSASNATTTAVASNLG
jgi:hypothetical protein